MSWEKIVFLLVMLFVVFPLLIKVVLYTQDFGKKPLNEHTEQGIDLIQEAATPWWLGIINWLLGYGIIGAFIIIGFFWVIKKADVV